MIALRLLRGARLFQERDKWLRTWANLGLRPHSFSTDGRSGWRTWRGVVAGFLPVGVCLVAVMQWRAYRSSSALRTARRWEVGLYCALPLRAFSRGWGWLAERRLPVFARPYLLGLYVSSFHVDLDEAYSRDLADYASLADFFSRPLRAGVRPVDAAVCLTSPCDGRVLNFGSVDSGRVEQVKGVTYSLRQFLEGEPTPTPSDATGEQYRRSLMQRPDGDRPTALYQCILYLAPGDYHRFHSPTDWKPAARRHFSGELLSVNPRVARFIPGLFTLNERAVYTGTWDHGFFSFTAVGATNVGSVRVYFDGALRTNRTARSRHGPDCVRLPQEVHLAKGEVMGEFRMGSTIVLIFEAPLNFEFTLAQGQTVRAGQAIGCARHVTHVDRVPSRITASAQMTVAA